jgi:hypothetical protein
MLVARLTTGRGITVLKVARPTISKEAKEAKAEKAEKAESQMDTDAALEPLEEESNK